MKAKHWFITTVTTTILILFLMAVIMIDIDPYFHYHGPVEGRSYALDGGGSYEKYCNDGIGKHFEYDLMITGSSVTENFQASEAEMLWGCKAVKTCFAGGTLKEVNEHVKRSIASNPNVSIIIRGIDENKLMASKDGFPPNAPTYLYDKNPFNDVNYLFNKDTWLGPLRNNIKYMRQDIEPTNFDQHSDWSIKGVFAKEMALSSYQRPPKSELTDDDKDMILSNIQGNIEQNIASTVRENPDVMFYYFLTPTSILQWDEWNQRGQMEYQILAEKLLIENLMQYDNVKIYGFSNNFDLITNLDNYMDEEHFSNEINSQILVWLKNGIGELNSSNYEKYIDDISKFYKNYNYEGLFDNA